MTTINDEQLLAYNQQGLIPGPQETEEEFIRRAEYCLNLKNTLAESSGEKSPFDFTNDLSNLLTKEFHLYDMHPSWVPVFFSNHKLNPWHGGCAWIFQLTETSPTAALFQLRKSLQKSNTYLGYYDRKELVTHELAHVGRMVFDEPKFEEMIAYRTSKSTLRKWLGPIIQTSSEGALFAFLLMTILMIDLFILFFGHIETFSFILALKIVPIALFGYGLIRLQKKHRQLNATSKKLLSMTNSAEKADTILYRLTDLEIASFGKLSPELIKKYICEEKERSLRWRLLHKAYFANL
jgi:hypothetical protein